MFSKQSIILSILLTAILGLAGFVFYRQFYLQPVSKQSITPVTKVSPLSQDFITPTFEDWKKQREAKTPWDQPTTTASFLFYHIPPETIRKQAEQYVASLPIPNDRDMERLKNDGDFSGPYTSFSQRIEEVVKQQHIDQPTKELILAGQAAELARRDILIKAYESEVISWPVYLASQVFIAASADKKIQQALSDKQYQAVYGSSKIMATQDEQAFWTPPNESEAIILFPAIARYQDGIIKNESDLFQYIDPQTMEYLMHLKKQQDYDGTLLFENFKAGKISEDEWLAQEKEARNKTRAAQKLVLTEEQTKILFGEPVK